MPDSEQTFPLFSASVHPQELPVDADTLQPEQPSWLASNGVQRFRHSCWARHRTLVYDALVRTRQSLSRIHAFTCCGEQAWVLRSVQDPSTVRVASCTCHDRLCVPCGRERSACIASNLAKLITPASHRFVTLTLKADSQPLRERLNRLYAAFRRLRQTAFWKRRVKGGVAFCEIKWNAASNNWHVHLHALTHGRYLHQPDLRQAWYKATGDSLVVDVRFVRDSDKAVRYVSKYCGKPTDYETLTSPALLDELVLATHGRRLVLPFGNWRNVTLLEKPADGEWEIVGDLETVLRRAASGEYDAMAIVDAIYGDRAAILLAEHQPFDSKPPPRKPDELQQFTFEWHQRSAPYTY